MACSGLYFDEREEMVSDGTFRPLCSNRQQKNRNSKGNSRCNHKCNQMPRYWSQNNPPYEVDFLIQRENDIFPVEVKSEANTTSKSMKKFKELFHDKVKLRIRFSLDNLKLDGDVLNIPLFMADQADRLIGLALEQGNAQ